MAQDDFIELDPARVSIKSDVTPEKTFVTIDGKDQPDICGIVWKMERDGRGNFNISVQLEHVFGALDVEGTLPADLRERKAASSTPPPDGSVQMGPRVRKWLLAQAKADAQRSFGGEAKLAYDAVKELEAE